MVKYVGIGPKGIACIGHSTVELLRHLKDGYPFQKLFFVTNRSVHPDYTCPDFIVTTFSIILFGSWILVLLFCFR